MVSTQSTWGHRPGVRVEQVQIELKERLFKMNFKTVSCVLALLFAAANARYIGTGASGQCNEIQFFPKCSSDQFIMNMMQCNRDIQSGYPYQSKGQCMSNTDQWISCMQSKLAMCMSSNCPSILGSILGSMDQFMPVFNSFQGINSLEQVYQTLDGVIDQVFTLLNINLPGQLDVIKQSGIKNWPVPLPGVNGLTIDQLLADLICPDPGVMPDSIQNILLSVESSWQLFSAIGYPDTSAYVPFCDGDFTQYIVNNLLQHAKAFYTATSRSEWCSVQTSLYEMGSNVLNSKCSFDRLATIFSQVGVPDALIAMFKDSPQLILYTSGCSDTYQPSNYQSQPQYSSNSQSSYPSQYSSNDQQYQSGGYQSQYATGNNYNDLGNFLQGLFGGSNMFGNSFGGLLGNSFLNPFGNLFPNLFGSPFGNSNRNIFGGFSLNPFGNFFPSLFGNPFQNLFGGSYRSNYQPGYQSQYSSNYQQYPSNGYQSQYSSNNQQYPSSGYQQSNYQSQYAPANNYNNLGSLFQNLLGNIGNIFPGPFGGSNLFGGSFQDIFGSLLQGLMGSSYPSNYPSQSAGYQGASSNYGSQSSGYEQSPPSGYESQPSEYQGTSSNYDSQSPGYQQSSSNYESQSPGY